MADFVGGGDAVFEAAGRGLAGPGCIGAGQREPGLSVYETFYGLCAEKLDHLSDPHRNQNAP